MLMICCMDEGDMRVCSGILLYFSLKVVTSSVIQWLDRAERYLFYIIHIICKGPIELIGG